MFSYSTGYYVSPPVDQYLKFKNRCSLVYTVYLFPAGKGGGVEPERRIEGQQFTNLGRKYMTD